VQNAPLPNFYQIHNQQGQGTGQERPSREQMRSMLQSFSPENRLDLVMEMAKDLRLGN
jgi:hypothetical protein